MTHVKKNVFVDYDVWQSWITNFENLEVYL